jgi:glucose/arabinose dehydrogenase
MPFIHSKNNFLIFLILMFSGIACSNSQESAPVQLESLKLPKGFKIDIYAEVDNARSLELSPSGILYVGNRSSDKVYAVVDTDGDYKADKKYIIDEDLKSPNGVAFYDGDLYVAEISRILKYSGIENDLSNPPEPEVIYDDYPTEGHHGWKYIDIGPDGKLYVPVGAPCNICKSKDPVFASLTRLNRDGSGFEIYAEGIRNTVGFTWHPETGDLWFTDNGRDHMGDDIPDCELNVITEAGKHYGYPYCHGASVSDPEFGDLGDCADYIPPVLKMGAHVAPLGLEFNSGSMFPETYKGDIFVALHGSWNRSTKVGYNVMRVSLNGNTVENYEVFIEGWLDDTAQIAWGRPVDVEFMKDGSMLVSDDYAGRIYRVSYR